MEPPRSLKILSEVENLQAALGESLVCGFVSSVEHMRHFPFEKSSLSSDDSGVKQSLPFVTLKFPRLRDGWQHLPGGLPL